MMTEMSIATEAGRAFPDAVKADKKPWRRLIVGGGRVRKI